MKLAAGERCQYYMLDLPWDIFNEDIGLTPSCRHLLPRNLPKTSIMIAPAAIDVAHLDRQEFLEIILNLLEVDKADFSPVRPFTSFGLDSLGAARISQALRPYLNISQMQLLGGLTWEKLDGLMEREKQKGEEAPVPADKMGDTVDDSKHDTEESNSNLKV